MTETIVGIWSISLPQADIVSLLRLYTGTGVYEQGIAALLPAGGRAVIRLYKNEEPELPVDWQVNS